MKSMSQKLLKNKVLRNNLRRRILSLAMVTVLSSGLLAGCGQTQMETQTQSATGEVVEGSAVSETVVTPAAEVLAASDGAVAVAAAQSFEFDASDFEPALDKAGAVEIALNGQNISVSIQDQGASAEGSVLWITKAGTYVLTGSLENGRVIVAVDSDEDVRLILNGVSISCADAPAIEIEEADRTTITLAEGTTNTLTMVATGSGQEDGEADVADGAIYSLGDLTLNGNGALVVNGSAKHGIVSKDDLRITGGSYVIQAAADAFRGKDLIAIAGGTFEIEAGSDAFLSSNDEAEDRGYILVEGGTFKIKAEADGFQATNALIIEDGDLTVDSADDSIHSNGSILIQGGTLDLSSGDDGIHADASIVIQDGEVRIAKSYEGVESASIEILGGDLEIVSSDDGINASSGADGSSAGGRPGQNAFDVSDGSGFLMSGGFVVVYADGDGVDLNGNGEMTGGTLLIHGPISRGNGALDYNGDFVQSGGLLVAAGSSGMVQGPGASSSTLSVQIFLTSQAAGTLVQVVGANGEEVVAFRPVKAYSSIVLASPEFETGKTYKVYVGGNSAGEEVGGMVSDGSASGGTEVLSFEIAGAVTQAVQEGASAGGMGGMGGMGGGKRPGN